MSYDTGAHSAGYYELHHLDRSISDAAAPSVEIPEEDEEVYFHTLAHELSDTALALLLGFAAQGHCRFTYDTDVEASGEDKTEEQPRLGEAVEGGLLAEEIAKVARNTFGIEAKVVNLRECATVDDAAVAMGVAIGKAVLPEMIVVTGLAEANMEIQGFVVEVMRTRRVELRRGGWVRSGELFMVVDVSPKKKGERRGISRHLANFFFISHHHIATPDDTSDASSFASVVVHKSPSSVSDSRVPAVPPDTIALLRDLADDVSISTEIKRYMLDLVVFLRMHRAVRSGCVGSRATKDFEMLVKCLAVIHGLDFVTPALVTLAIMKVYNHRIEILERPELERSVVYGSEAGTIKRYLKGIEPELVIDDVVKSVRPPL